MQSYQTFTTAFSATLEADLLDRIEAYEEFGLRYDVDSETWKVITSTNLSTSTVFDLPVQDQQQEQMQMPVGGSNSPMTETHTQCSTGNWITYLNQNHRTSSTMTCKKKFTTTQQARV